MKDKLSKMSLEQKDKRRLDCKYIAVLEDTKGWTKTMPIPFPLEEIRYPVKRKFDYQFDINMSDGSAVPSKTMFTKYGQIENVRFVRSYHKNYDEVKNILYVYYKEYVGSDDSTQ